MQLPGVKYNLAHGFPDDQPSSKLERIIITNHLKDNQYDLVINQTWGFLEYQNPVTKEPSDKFKICEYLVSNKLANKVLFFNFVDPIYDLSTWYEVFDTCKKANKDFELTCMGQVDNNKIELQYPFAFWAVFVSDNFKNYSEDETNPNNFDNLFLCYNRKPHWHRQMLHDQMTKHGVINKGIFTLGNEDKSQIKMVNADKTTLPSDDERIHGELGIPNDTLTLGTLEAWNSHLVTIITETQHVPVMGFPWFSEKIWKPIIGMRPYLLLGDGNSIKYLEDNGFYTFNRVFGIDKDDITISDIVSAIKRFNQDPAEVYQSVLDQLRHNKKRFYEFAKEQKKIFDL
tara:strand:+ start:95 stop:1123 length:1029 start_codon:yes stop_codon:yes gene_type:complete